MMITDPITKEEFRLWFDRTHMGVRQYCRHMQLSSARFYDMLAGRSQVPRYILLATKALVPATTAPTPKMLKAGAVAVRSILFPDENLTLQSHKNAALAAWQAMLSHDERGQSIR